MAGLAVLIPVGVLGLVLWVVLLLTRRSAPFTLSTAASFYAHLMTIAGATMTLAGLALVIKVLLAKINGSYGYFVESNNVTCPPAAAQIGKCFNSTVSGPTVTDQMRPDIVLGIVLLVIGLLVLASHYALARTLRTHEGGANPIVIKGSLVAFTVLYGLVGLVSVASALYAVLNFALAPAGQNPGPFADSVGAAIAFTPAWVYAALRLLQATRRPAAATPAPAPV